MKDNKLLGFISILVIIGLVIFTGFKYSQEEKEKEEQKPTPEIKEEEEPTPESEGYIILTKVTYNNNYRTTIRLYSDGKLEQSTIKEETVYQEGDKEKYVDIGEVTEEELSTIKEIINKMAKEEMKKTDLSDSYGISVRLRKSDKILYSAEYFNQEEINTINNIIINY